MAKLIIEGGHRLSGQVTVHGAKNGALPLMAAAMLIGEPVQLLNCPRLSDVEHMGRLLKGLGCLVQWQGDTLCIDAGGASSLALPKSSAGAIRSSAFLLGPLLGRFGAAEVPYPGGCNIGDRPLDLHLKGLKALGIRVEEGSGCIRCYGRPKGGVEISLEYPSVGATENLIMAACGAEADTVLVNPAREPEVDDLMVFLNAAGFALRREGSSRIRIRGGGKGRGLLHRVLPDRIEAGTFLTAAAITGGKVLVRGARGEHMSALLQTLREAGCRIRTTAEGVELTGPERPKEIRFSTMPYPGFPTDMQSQVFALCTLAKGTSLVEETVFENRFAPAAELRRMGADCRIRGRTALIRGVKAMRGAEVTARDLRGGAALVLAGLAAQGITEVYNAQVLSRGYENLAAALKGLGASIRKEDQSP